jgi:hypothetical protein
MKKLLITMAATLVAVAAFAQGTVTFNNGGLNKVSLGVTGSASSTWTVMPTTPGGYVFGLFYGNGGNSTALTFISSLMGVNSTATAGVIADPSDAVSAMNAFKIPGSLENATDTWIKMVGYTASFGTNYVAAQAAANAGTAYFGSTPIINALALGASTGPGAAIWQTAAGTDPQKFHAMTLFTTTAVPEPSTMALFGLGAAAMLIIRRRK